MNILFVCSRNTWRSPTAEAIYKNNQAHNVKSAGTEPSARIKISARLVLWADTIFVMEKKHKQRLLERFYYEVQGKPVIVLDIADEYKFMDQELVEMLKISVNEYLNQHH